jgi:DNA-directed RNA polymerase subunit M/transcription elongation factor TFIIS
LANCAFPCTAANDCTMALVRLRFQGATMAHGYHADCPQCRLRVNVRRWILNATLYCPQCGSVYHYERPGVSPLQPNDSRSPRWQAGLETTIEQATPQAQEEGVPRSARTPVASILAAPHLCQHCKHAIQSPTGFRRSSVDCPSCGCSTSVYALLFHCRCGACLETPTSQSGEEIDCPSCGERQTVPWDVLEKHNPDPADENWFAIECQNCSVQAVAHKEDVGTLAVCPACLSPLTVPHWGERLAQAKPARDALEALQDGGEAHCPQCRQLIPKSSRLCPKCGATL